MHNKNKRRCTESKDGYYIATSGEVGLATGVHIYVYPQEMDPNGSPALGLGAFISSHPGSHTSVTGIWLKSLVLELAFFFSEDLDFE